MSKHELRNWFMAVISIQILTVILLLMWTARIYRAVHGLE